MVYYGISYNTSDLSGDPYLNFAFAVTAELIAILSSYVVYEKLGRKLPYVINLLTSGICLIAVLFVPKGI